MEESLKKRQEEFLSHFPWYWWKIFPDQHAKNSISTPNKNRTLEECLELNSQYPSSLYFTPNGRFADTNQIWSMCSINPSKSCKEEWVYAYVLDFNMIKFPDKNMETLLEYIKALLSNRLIIERRYIVKTRKWYHVYFIIDHEDRQAAFDSYWYNQLKIVKHMADMLWADCTSKVTENVWALFRIPYSVYWHLAEKDYVSIVAFQDKYVTLSQIDDLWNYLQQYEWMKKAEKRAFQWSNWAKYREFSNKPISHIAKKLQDLWYFKWIDLTYSSVNSVVCKIWSDLYKNPAWRPYELVRCANHWDDVATRTMLNTHFWIKELQAKDWSGNIVKVIEWNWYVISFFEMSVQLKKFEANSKWDLVEKTKVIFRNNIQVIWRWKTTSSKMWESDWERQIFILYMDDQERIIENLTSKKDFNKRYPRLFFYWDDNDLWLFFHWLNSCEDIDEINVYERSWYYGDVCILWDRCVVWYLWQDKILLWDNEFDLALDTIQISAAEYLEKFTECYVEEFSIPVFLSALALAWMNLWDMLEVNPAMLLAWKTWCWKSTVSALLKRMLWYAPTVREMALPWITPQPLKQTASDNAILFLEELTNRVWPWTEELLRNIVNRDKAARGWLDWNTWWRFRSPLRVNWERTFKDESLNNRFCSFIMSPAYWKEWASPKINELQKYTAYNDIYNTYINSKEVLADLVIEYKNKLLDKWYPARACDVWCYIFVVNEIFNFKFPYEELVRYVDLHLSNTWLKEKKWYDNIIAFERFLTVNIINRKINLTIRETHRDTSDWKTVPRLMYDMLFIDDLIYQTSRWFLNAAVAEINKKFWEEVFTVDEWGIIWYMCNVRSKDFKFVSDKDQFVADIFWRIVSVLPYNISSNNRTLMYVDWL